MKTDRRSKLDRPTIGLSIDLAAEHCAWKRIDHNVERAGQPGLPVPWRPRSCGTSGLPQGVRLVRADAGVASGPADVGGQRPAAGPVTGGARDILCGCRGPRRVQPDAVKPRIQYVLTQWKCSFIAFRRQYPAIYALPDGRLAMCGMRMSGGPGTGHGSWTRGRFARWLMRIAWTGTASIAAGVIAGR